MALIPIHFMQKKTNFDFMGKRWFGFIASILLTLGAFGLLATKGLNLGIDFTGGILMEVRTPETADLGAMREALNGQGFGEISLQNFGSDKDVLIRIQTSKDVEQAQVVQHAKELLTAAIPTLEYRKLDYVGPTVGAELVQSGIIATVLAFGAIMAYVWFRFEWQYGVGAILALLHDSIMVVGFFALTRFEFGLPALAAVLTIIGYSINDSVVIYDRIRENMRKYKKMSVSDLLNLSMNETISRTILTAGTTLLAALSLALFGGEVLAGFSWSMVFGILVGTYSSIYISGPALIYLNLRSNTQAQAVAA
jgi:preprotein translocase subunit SecF